MTKPRYILYQTMADYRGRSRILANKATRREIENARKFAIEKDGIDPGYLFIKQITLGKKKKKRKVKKK